MFCGFLAEYKLEHVIENSKEKEYIASMITDAENDSAALTKAIIKISKLQPVWIRWQTFVMRLKTQMKCSVVIQAFWNYAANFE